jgi:hypothetical protein
VDLGNVLRVPVAQLEAVLGVALDLNMSPAPVGSATPVVAAPPEPPAPQAPTRRTQTRTPKPGHHVDQLNLLDPDAA